jgi:hypothetical protein
MPIKVIIILIITFLSLSAAEPVKKKRSFLRKSHSLMSTESERSTQSTTSVVTQSSDGNTVIENVKVVKLMMCVPYV